MYTYIHTNDGAQGDEEACNGETKERESPSVCPSIADGARISHLHRNKLSGTMGSFVHSEHCKHAATVFPRTNGKALQYALLTLSTLGPAIIERPRLSFVYRTIISYLVTLHTRGLASLRDTRAYYTRVLHGSSICASVSAPPSAPSVRPGLVYNP